MLLQIYLLAIPMLYILNFLNGIFHNYGIAIIILTIIVKVLTLPLTLKSMVSIKAELYIMQKILVFVKAVENNRLMDLLYVLCINPL